MPIPKSTLYVPEQHLRRHILSTPAKRLVAPITRVKLRKAKVSQPDVSLVVYYDVLRL